MTQSKRAAETWVLKAAMREYKLWAPVYRSKKHSHQHIDAVLALYDACETLARQRKGRKHA